MFGPQKSLSTEVSKNYWFWTLKQLRVKLISLINGNNKGSQDLKRLKGVRGADYKVISNVLDLQPIRKLSKLML